MPEPKISIVIPVYNTGDFVQECLNSVLCQTYNQIEVVVVNDGSTDNSAKVCDQYAQKYPNVKVLHIENAGVANARKTGVQNAQGEYIIFLDSDDTLPKNAVTELVNAIDQNTDIVLTGYSIITGNNKKLFEVKEKQLNQIEYIKALLEFNVNVAPWAKLYRKTLFTPDSFPNFKKGQDVLMNIQVAMRTKSVRIKNVITYNYLYSRPNSSVHINHAIFETQKEKCQIIQDLLKQYNLTETLKDSFIQFKLHQYLSVIKSGGKVSAKDPWMRQLSLELERVKLSPILRVVKMSIKIRPLRPLLYYTRMIFGFSTAFTHFFHKQKQK